jgi:hypothetical protein
MWGTGTCRYRMPTANTVILQSTQLSYFPSYPTHSLLLSYPLNPLDPATLHLIFLSPSLWSDSYIYYQNHVSPAETLSVYLGTRHYPPSLWPAAATRGSQSSASSETGQLAAAAVPGGPGLRVRIPIRIRIRIRSGFNRVSGSGFGIRIQEGKNDSQK